MSPHTEKTYLYWAKYYWRFHNRRHPREMGEREITAFLNHLANEMKVSASTQNQALCALVFLYKRVLNIEIGKLGELVWAKRPLHLPSILSVEEIQAIIKNLKGVQALIGCLLYGTGMRLAECLKLRVKDIDFERNLITIRDAKGEKDRAVPMPASVKASLRAHMDKVRIMHQNDTKAGFGRVYLPYALERKYPNANAEWCWKFVFPSVKLSKDPISGETRRHHLYGNIMQDALARAVRLAGIPKKVSCHSFRHSYATHLLESGEDIRKIQELLGHNDIKTTMIYTHVTKDRCVRVKSPQDNLNFGPSEKNKAVVEANSSGQSPPAVLGNPKDELNYSKSSSVLSNGAQRLNEEVRRGGSVIETALSTDFRFFALTKIIIKFLRNLYRV